MARILLVEDNEMNSELARFLIENAGHDFVAAADGIEALSIAQKNSFDIILLDIQLPKMDGYAVLQQLKQIISPAVPVIAVSSYAMVGDTERALAAGFDGYLSKPIKAATFVQDVMRLAKI